MTNQFTQTTVPSTSNVNNDINQQHFQESPQYQNSPQYLDSPQYQNTFQYESPQYPVAPNYEHEVQPTVQVATVQPVQTNLAADDQNAMMFFILGFVIFAPEYIPEEKQTEEKTVHVQPTPSKFRK
ncbi:hypothetical protein QTN25_000123 [Entamoeba marina]